MTPDFSRFLAAQDSGDGFTCYLQRIKDGNVGGIWMDYVFPQIFTNSKPDSEASYMLYSLYEAEAYMCDETLSNRLYDAARAILDNHYGTPIGRVFGYTAGQKIHSCMTVFDVVNPGCVFERVLDAFFDGKRCDDVLASVERQRNYFHGDVGPYEQAGLGIIERAMFDSYGDETYKYSKEEKYASYLRLYRMGYSPLDLGRLYLVNHRDIYNGYRTSGMESYLSFFTMEFAFDVVTYAKENCGDDVLSRTMAQFKPIMNGRGRTSIDWELCAVELESVMAYVSGNRDFDGYVRQLESRLLQNKNRLR
ncbi:MAG: DUF1810 family protein [Muribaculaceae bacterium]